ncbi:BCD family MFS transporter [Sulfitobacter guttiformis]|uniref:BCD family chlorophyll transporter-like MFS transporter n=1 Tax=Sulfitobacter guttiformis TaxID=74349 RepID=J7FWK1_9RHOB|nr:BCD family MFS transporter [Sulfitobacter guttiformis]AFP55488.1 bacteriochlorophyll synthase PucC [Sulfitobacter guttiformis]KIN75496.1 Bacteriochlorophyll synthase PucC [Sulfitobacter guttiformis KCTC 32187]RKE92110.1 BCD family chlorophyll transporter-like MFS transporter [Sulfitobacter guttiformis]
MHLTWIQIFRLGLVQMALGAIVVLTTSTLNRLMVVEFALPAVLPGALVGLHYGIQLSRPRWGFISDKGGNRTAWIIGGMALLALGGLLAAYAVTLFAASHTLALGLSLIAYAAIGLGVGASGTSLLALLATTTAPHRRAAAATITWLMMIFGIAFTAGLSGGFLDPYSPARLMGVVAVVVSIAMLLTVVAVGRIERGLIVAAQEPPTPFLEGLRDIWAEPRARNFTLFVFLSMNAYFMQELILEPYAGLVFDFSAGQSTQLSGAQNGGVFLGMLTVGIMATGLKRGSLRAWVTAGCLGSAGILGLIALNGAGIAFAPLTPLVTALGFFNGMFAVAAIGSMMALASDGRERREGTRMGLWGAAQAVAAGFGGLLGAGAVDILRITLPDGAAFGAVFTFEAFLFVAAAIMALRILDRTTAQGMPALVPGE